jgi:hypothetical protein
MRRNRASRTTPVIIIGVPGNFGFRFPSLRTAYTPEPHAATVRDRSNPGAPPPPVSLWFAPLRCFSLWLAQALGTPSKPSENVRGAVCNRSHLLRQIQSDPLSPPARSPRLMAGFIAFWGRTCLPAPPGKPPKSLSEGQFSPNLLTWPI